MVDSKLIPTSVEIRHQNVSIITAKMWAEVSSTTSMPPLTKGITGAKGPL